MFYFSRAEQAALVLLVCLLLVGGGILLYSRGERAGEMAAEGPLLVPAPAAVPHGATAAQTGPSAESRAPGHEGNAPARTGTPPLRTRTRAGAHPEPAFPIRLNSASAQELEALPGIGPVLAERIVRYREELERTRGHGFESVDELLNVPGIGPRRLAGIRDLVTP